MRQKRETLRRRVVRSLAVLLDGRGWLLYNSTRVWLDQYRFEGWLALLEEPYKNETDPAERSG
jgi:hypothetical protein